MKTKIGINTNESKRKRWSVHRHRVHEDLQTQHATHCANNTGIVQFVLNVTETRNKDSQGSTAQPHVLSKLLGPMAQQRKICLGSTGGGPSSQAILSLLHFCCISVMLMAYGNCYLA
jgi:hypothetical protein